jgi:hypothetical protein
VRSSRKSPRAAAPAMAATGAGKDRMGDYQGTLADASCATRRSAISPAKRGEIGGISLDLMANLDSKE